MKDPERQAILVVDDDGGARALIDGCLQGSFDLLRAVGYEEAMTLLKSRSASCAVLDLSAAGGSARDFLCRAQINNEISHIPYVALTTEAGQEEAYRLGATSTLVSPCKPSVLLACVNSLINRRDQSELNEPALEIDRLTGIYSKRSFYQAVRHYLDTHPDTVCQIIRFDIDRFKVFNDTYGTAAGDRLLRDIGAALARAHNPDSLYGHLDADHFAFFTPLVSADIERGYERLQGWFQRYPVHFGFSIKVGVYTVTDPHMDVGNMFDRAKLALKSIKGSATTHIAYYDHSLREQLLREQELLGDVKAAFENGQFEVYYQPQYNYDNGKMIGAESLVRWNHPTRGLIPPGQFIPVMERNGLISRLDEFVWERCCQDARRWIDTGGKAIAITISTNVSRVDVYRSDLCNLLDELTARYGLPKKLLHVEITESAYMDNPTQLIATVDELHDRGFTVAMDDFGSGYSSLNTLKDVPVDLLKLDMKFLSASQNDSRGGNILSSVVRMARWLKLPVIAEGVETKEQADYLKSIGCQFMQGFFFARPMPIDQFEELLARSETGTVEKYKDVDTQDADQFWDLGTQTAMLFNSYVGGAAIIELTGDNVEALRVNDRCLEQLQVTREHYEPLMLHVQDPLTPPSRERLLSTLREAERTGRETGCELCLLERDAAGQERWLKCRARLLSRNVGSDLFYITVDDISQSKRLKAEADKQHAYLHSLYEAIPFAVMQFVVKDERLELQSFNERAWRFFGYESVEAFRRGLRDTSVPFCVHPDDVRRVRESEHELIGGESELSYDYRVLRSRGETRWVRAYCRRAEANGELLVSCALLDVTELREAELQSYGKALFALFDEVSLLDFEGQTRQLLHTVYKGKQLWRVRQGLDKLIAEWVDHYIVPKDREAVRAYLDLDNIHKSFEEGVTPRLSYRFLTSKGGELSCATSLAHLDGDRYLLCSRDISRWAQEYQDGGMLDRRRVQEEDAAREAFEGMMESGAGCLTIIDPDTYTVLYSNEASRKQMGAQRGQPCYTQFSTSGKPCPKCPVQAWRETGQSTPVVVFDANNVERRIQAIPMLWQGKVCVAVFTAGTDDGALDEDERLRLSRENTLRRYTNILFAMYEEIYELDLAADSARLLGSKHRPDGSGTVVGGLSEMVQKYAQSHVAMADRAALLSFLDGDEIRAAFAKGSAPSLDYRVLAEGEPQKWLRSTIMNVGGDCCLLCTRDVTTQKRADELSDQNAVLVKHTQEQESARAALETATRRLDNIISNVPVGITICRVDLPARKLYPVFMSDKACAMFGYERQEYDRRIASGLPADYSPDLSRLPRQGVDAVMAGESAEFRMRLRRKDQSWIWVSCACKLIHQSGKQPLCYASLYDVTRAVEEEKRANWQSERYRIISEAIRIMMFDFAPDEDQMTITKPGQGGALRETVLRGYLADFDAVTFVHPDYRADYRALLKSACKKAENGIYDFVADYGDGYRWYRTHYVSIEDESGHVYRVLGRLDDIDEERRAQERLREKAEIDSLTGLTNRDTASVILQSMFKERPPESVDALILIDLDHFKRINDSLGHAQGDQALKAFADKLKRLFRREDIVARYGGDEFLVYMRGVGSAELAVQRARDINAAARSIALDGLGTAQCSIGVVVVEGEAVSFEDVFNRADYALYTSKSADRNTFTLYDPQMMSGRVSELGAWRER